MSGRWSLGSEVKHTALKSGAMLYNASFARNASDAWFDPNHWEALGAIEGRAQGRGTVLFIKSDAKRYVLRHYYRGGFMGKFTKDRYRWRGEDETRSFHEWQLTYRLHRAGLPVPAPIAARYIHNGRRYTGDIITERLPTVGSLTQCLEKGALSVMTWISIGRCIRRFHDLGVCHADLNAHNILLSEEAKVYLIDFDRCQLRRDGFWRDGNLVRLRRSLEKVTYSMPSDRFSESDWHGLLDGYRQSSGDRPLATGAPTPAVAPGT